MATSKLSGIGGFLLLFVIFAGELVALIARALCCVIGLVLIFVFLIAVVVLIPVEMFFGSQFYAAVRAHMVEAGKSPASFDESHHVARWENIGALVWSGAWALYWRASERVRLTFTPEPSAP